MVNIKQLRLNHRDQFAFETNPIKMIQAGVWERFCTYFNIKTSIVAENKMANTLSILLPADLAEEWGLIEVRSQKSYYPPWEMY